ncbi:hypothetical protein [Prosthecobacter sp.]|uniref:hypothetical protein n=1 Tax=Prosthecobacter sp. TaxID=1965333 RepID=UPI0037852231
MLSTRSARLAALLLLTLLSGWTIRSCRKPGPSRPQPTAPATKPPVEAAPKSTFPDE